MENIKKQILQLFDNYQKSLEYTIMQYDIIDREKIMSVKRNSDGEVFTIGDEIIYNEIFPVKLKIKSVQLFNHEILIHKDCTMNTNKLSEIKKISSQNEFKKAVEPAIRYLLKNHDPHTKIIIDYSNAELVQGQKCCNLNNEIPD